MSWIAVLIVVVVVAVLFSIAHLQTKAANQAWQAAARQMGLQFRPAALFVGPKLEGTLRECTVKVDTYRTGGKHSKTYSRFDVRFGRPLGLNLRVTSEGFVSSVAKWFGAQDIEVGDTSFDRAARVKGAHDASVRDFLNPARRIRILRCLKRYPSIEIDDTGIRWQKLGIPRKVNELMATTQDFVRLAWHLTGDRDDDHRLQQAMTLQNEGQPEEALRMLETTLQAHAPAATGDPPTPPAEAELDEPVEEEWLAGELYQLGGQTEQSRQMLQRAHSASSQDTDLGVWTDKATPPREPTRSAAPPAYGETLGSAADVSAELFRDGVTTFECKQIFETRYAGRRVQWSGTLLKLERNHSSFLFELPGGTNATIKVDERQSPYFGPQHVLAIVHVSDGTVEQLRDRRGQAVSFSGTLVKVDGLMRNLFVDHGTLDVDPLPSRG